MRRANAFTVIFLVVEFGLFLGCPICVALGYTVAGMVCIGLFSGIILLSIIVVSISVKLNTKERRDAKYERERAAHEREYREAKERYAEMKARNREFFERYEAARNLGKNKEAAGKKEAVARLTDVLRRISSAKSASIKERLAPSPAKQIKKPRRIQ